MIRKVEIAGVNTANLPVSSNEEKQELLVKIKNGDNEEKFISRKFKISTVCHTTIYLGCGENMDDLFQIDCVWLD